MTTEVHTIKFKSLPTHKFKNCLKCDKEENNIEHVLYHCLVRKFVGNIIRDIIKMNLDLLRPNYFNDTN